MRISRPPIVATKHCLSSWWHHPPHPPQRRLHGVVCCGALPPRTTTSAMGPMCGRRTITTVGDGTPPTAPFWSATSATTTTTTTIPKSTHTVVRWHGGSAVSADAPTVTITFLQPDGTTPTIVQARVGETLLQTAHRYEIDLEGACEGVCACSTCHLILPSDLYHQLPEPSEDEDDMLDMAFGLTETSRLGCQITVTPAMEGVVLEMPKATRNFYVDGHKPKPH